MSVPATPGAPGVVASADVPHGASALGCFAADRLPARRVDMGLTDYNRTWSAMKAFTDERDAYSQDQIWLTEHSPVYTLGLAGRTEHLLRPNAIPVIKVDRGGQVTYHGPGQIIAYLLIDLRRRGSGVRHLVRRMEAAVIESLAAFGVAAFAIPGAPGVYVRTAERDAKVAALGLKVRKGCTYHGLAINHDMDLAPFADIDPCGYPGLAVTQVRDLGVRAMRREVEDRLTAALIANIYGKDQAALS